VTVWGLRDLLSGVDDQRDSLVTIRAGAGGVDAEDFTYMLFRMAAITILKAKLLACSRATEPTGADPVERDQVRSYVLQPHPMVRDLRTGVASGNPTGVFDGDIDAFIEAGVRRRRAGR
jgi:protein subunit release factor B